jgi:alkanesulfonate monooxygenase SsuD/methylene tetrahydromethanopterin reductase-like flavin-dependent oxidoreductase (luciferase family)
VGILDQAAQAAGRNPTHVGIGFHVNAWVSRDGNVPASVQQAIWQHIGIHRTWHGQDPASIDLEEIRQQSILGTPDDVVRQVQPWIEPFRDRELHILFRLHYPGLLRREVEAALRLFASEVIPALKGASIRE